MKRGTKQKHQGKKQLTFPFINGKSAIAFSEPIYAKGALVRIMECLIDLSQLPAQRHHLVRNLLYSSAASGVTPGTVG